jgi:hypothetical protein
MDRCESHDMTCPPALTVEVLRVEERLVHDVDAAIFTGTDAALSAGAGFDMRICVIATTFADVDEPIRVVELFVCASSPDSKANAWAQSLLQDIGFAGRLAQVQGVVDYLACLSKAFEVGWAEMRDDVIEDGVLCHRRDQAVRWGICVWPNPCRRQRRWVG